MNTAAVALPHRRLQLHLDQIRGLYNGLGYVVVISLVLALWWTTQQTLPQLLAGHTRGFALGFTRSVCLMLFAMTPGFLLLPLVVNLAPRAPLLRFGCLSVMTLLMGAWCFWTEGSTPQWDWPSLGSAIDCLLTPSMVVVVCVFHSDSRQASDALMQARIGRASLDGELMQAQLQRLRAQIEPHFLFNTLSVIRVLSRSDRPATVAMLDNLIRYFEAAVPRLRESEVPLAQELDLIEAYLAIYRTRLGTRLHYEVALPPELARLKVPSMMLLTLVENAVKHGVSATLDGGLIRVSASCTQNRLLLKVADSGSDLAVRHGQGVGLANVRQRLLMMYGEEAELSLRPTEPRGMVASIALPVN